MRCPTTMPNTATSPNIPSDILKLAALTPILLLVIIFGFSCTTKLDQLSLKNSAFQERSNAYLASPVTTEAL